MGDPMNPSRVDPMAHVDLPLTPTDLAQAMKAPPPAPVVPPNPPPPPVIYTPSDRDVLMALLADLEDPRVAGLLLDIAKLLIARL